MACPKCKAYKSRLAGKTYPKNRIFSKQRFQCLKCGFYFLERDINFKKKVPNWIRKRVIKLYNSRKAIVNKYDNMKKRTYSTREIAKKLNVSKTYVWKVTRK